MGWRGRCASRAVHSCTLVLGELQLGRLLGIDRRQGAVDSVDSAAAGAGPDPVAGRGTTADPAVTGAAAVVATACYAPAGDAHTGNAHTGNAHAGDAHAGDAGAGVSSLRLRDVAQKIGRAQG